MTADKASKKNAKAAKKYPHKPRPKTSRWLKVPAITVAVLVSVYVLIFYVAPFFAMRYAEQWYAEQGEGQSLFIGGWTLSPFTGEVELRNVEAAYPVKGQKAHVGAEFVGININLSELFGKTIHVQSVGVRGLTFRGVQTDEGLSLAGIDLPSSGAGDPGVDPGSDASVSEQPAGQEDVEGETDGKTESASGPLPEGWTVRVDDIALIDDRVRWEQSGLTVAVKLSRLTTGLFDSSQQNATPVSLDITLEELLLELGEETLRLNKAVTLTLSGEADSLLTNPAINGDISLSSLDLDVPGIDKVEFSALDIKGASFAMSESGMVAGLKKLVLKNVRAELPDDEKAQFDQLLISSVKWRATEDDVAIGSATLEGVAGNLAGFPELGLQKLSLNKAKVSKLSSAPDAELASAGLEGLRAVHPEAGLLTLQALNVASVNANAEAQNVGTLSVDGIEIMPPQGEQPLVSLAHYEIADIAATPESFKSGVHKFYGLFANATLLEDGTLKDVPAAAEGSSDSEVASDIEATPANEKMGADDADSNGPAAAFRVQIAGIELIEPESESSTPVTGFKFTDQSVSPNVTTNGRVLTLKTGAIDSADLEQGIDLELVLALDEYNRITTKGRMGLKGDYPEGNIDLDIEQLNLVAFNPYVVKAMGYRIKKGMLGVDSTIKITDGQLGGKLVINLKNSKFEPADEETIDRLSKQISMPVDTALSVLRDDNNNIRIEVPLSGDISSPDVGINDVINQVTRKALKAATLYYLKQSMVPYGQLISIASFASDQIFAIRLNDLEFEEQQTDLTDKHKEYLDTVGDMMSKKTELELQVCPVASEKEATVWGDNWAIEVAKRSANVKAYLAGRKDNNDKSLAGRITLCTPSKDDKAEVILGV